MKRVVAVIALGTALALADVGCSGRTSAPVRRGTLAPVHVSTSVTVPRSSSGPGHGILLVGQGEYGKSRIFLWRPGSPTKALSPAEGGCGGGGGFCAAMSGGGWSPDGRSIAFEADELGGLAPPTPNMLVMRSDGKHLKVLAFDASETTGTDGLPSWSPDSRQIVYKRDIENWDTGGSLRDFAIVDVPSGHQRILRAGRLATGDPVWGKAGIAYPSDSGIMLLNPATGRSRLVTRRFSSGALAWSPGGVLAVWEPTQIVLLVPSGRTLGKLPIPSAIRRVCAITWTPDGKQIVASTQKGAYWLDALWVGTVSTKDWQRLPPVPTGKRRSYSCAVSWR